MHLNRTWSIGEEKRIWRRPHMQLNTGLGLQVANRLPRAFLEKVSLSFPISPSPPLCLSVSHSLCVCYPNQAVSQITELSTFPCHTRMLPRISTTYDSWCRSLEFTLKTKSSVEECTLVQKMWTPSLVSCFLARDLDGLLDFSTRSHCVLELHHFSWVTWCSQACVHYCHISCGMSLSITGTSKSAFPVTSVSQRSPEHHFWICAIVPIMNACLTEAQNTSDSLTTPAVLHLSKSTSLCLDLLPVTLLRLLFGEVEGGFIYYHVALCSSLISW